MFPANWGVISQTYLVLEADNSSTFSSRALCTELGILPSLPPTLQHILHPELSAVCSGGDSCGSGGEIKQHLTQPLASLIYLFL